MKKNTFALALTAALAAPVVSAQTPDQKIEVLQQEIDDLKAQIRKMPAARQPGATQTPVDVASPVDRGAGPGGGNTSLAGYGEANYGKFRESGDAKADLRRFVFGLDHRFDDRLTFHSEIELEHAVVSREDDGEVEIEQAWLNYRSSDAVNVKGGLFLIPLGVLNETHEPPTYYGVERNEVETRIIPTTWRELGFGVHGELGEGFRYDAGITTGFNSGKLDDPTVGIRSAHQEGQLADAHDLSVYVAINYRRPGLLAGGGVFTGNTGQNGQANPLLKGVAARLTLWDVHARYRVDRLDLQALYASGTLGDADRLNAAVGTTAATPFAVPKSMRGAYAQAAYHAYKDGKVDVAPFVRIERFEIKQQEDPANGLFQDPNNFERVTTVGVNFKLHPQIVVKADAQRYHTDKSKDRFNLGVGYMF